MELLTELMASPHATLGGLFVASFLAATLLPGGSEAALFALLRLHPDQWLAALALATLGNTLGGMSTYLIGRLVPARQPLPRLDLVRRHGAPALLLAWAPVIGDALCAAAGWLRLSWVACMLWMAVGKMGRYAAVIWAAGMI